MSAQVKTRFGLTRIIRIKDIIKQGGVLSVTEYSKLIDEINEELKNQGLGILYGDILINSLLSMDDIAVCSDCPVEMQSILSVIYSFSLKWHLKFSKKKSKILIINETEDTQNLEWQLGAMTIERCSEYTYLGEIISNDGMLIKKLEREGEKSRSRPSNNTEPLYRASPQPN